MDAEKEMALFMGDFNMRITVRARHGPDAR
jgi:hypothetical protein